MTSRRNGRARGGAAEGGDTEHHAPREHRPTSGAGVLFQEPETRTAGQVDMKGKIAGGTRSYRVFGRWDDTNPDGQRRLRLTLREELRRNCPRHAALRIST
jgi:hypothetical protein